MHSWSRSPEPPPLGFYGACAVLLGCWEAAAKLRLLPTITCTVRRNRATRTVAFIWVCGLWWHFEHPG